MSQQRAPNDVHASTNNPNANGEEAATVSCTGESANDDKNQRSKAGVGVLIACFVCKRKFPSEAMLAKHKKKSRLHRENLARMSMAIVDAKGLEDIQMKRKKGEKEEIAFDAMEQKPSPVLSAASSMPIEKEALNKVEKEKEESRQCQFTDLIMKESEQQTSYCTKKTRVVGLPEDKKLMSLLNWLIVSNIQFCLADGAVGIECRHCADDISVNRAVNALCMPSTTKDIGKSSRFIAFHHFPICPYFPSPERKIIKECFSETSYESVLQNKENLLGLTSFCETVAEKCLNLADDYEHNQIIPLTSQNTQNFTVFPDRSLSVILSDEPKGQQVEPSLGTLGSEPKASDSVEFSLELDTGKIEGAVFQTHCPDETGCISSPQKQPLCYEGCLKQGACDSDFSNKFANAGNEAPFNAVCPAEISYDAANDADYQTKVAIADDDCSKASTADHDIPEGASTDVNDPKAISNDTDCPKESANEANEVDCPNGAPIILRSPKEATTTVDNPQRAVRPIESIDFDECHNEVPNMVDCLGIVADDKDCPKEGADVFVCPEILACNAECPKVLADVGAYPDMVACDKDCQDGRRDIDDCPKEVACNFHCTKDKVDIGHLCPNEAEYDADSPSEALLNCDPENVLSLHSPSDEDNLTPMNSFLRKYCVEAFISDSKGKGPHNLSQYQAVPQVGMRCRFCRDSTKTSTMSVVFPRRTTMVYDACMSILQKHFLQSKCPKIPKAIVDELRAKSAEHETFVEANVSSAADDKVARQIAYEAAKIEKMGVSNGPKGLLKGPAKAQESKCEVIKSRKMGFTDSSMSLMKRSRVKASADPLGSVTDQSMLTSEFSSSKNAEFQGEEKSTDDVSPPVSSNANSCLSSVSFRNKRSSRSVQEEATKSRQHGNDSSMIEDGDSEYCTSYMKLFMSLLEIWCPAAGKNHDPINRCHLRCRKCAASDSTVGVFTIVSSLYCFLFAFFSKLFFSDLLLMKCVHFTARDQKTPCEPCLKIKSSNTYLTVHTCRLM